MESDTTKMKYPPTLSVAAPSVTGATAAKSAFTAWLPSTWPNPDANQQLDLVTVVRTVFHESIMREIDNVIKDAGGDLRHRGHVVAIAVLCALDAISSYGYGAQNGRQIPEFIRKHFPDTYRPHGGKLLKLYRHAMVHSWNLFQASILPGNEPVKVENGVLCFGLLNFRDALWRAVDDYLAALSINQNLQTKTSERYRRLVRTAKR
jgi:hypothetical protein